MDKKQTQRLGLVILILIACAACDQAIKAVAKESLASSPPISLLYDSIRIEYSENPGAFLSLGSSLSSEARFIIFVILVGIVLIFTIAFTFRNAHKLSLMQLIGLSLVGGGGVGNLLDRLLNDGHAVDFIRLGIGPLRTGIFNLADVAILTGVGILIVFSLKKGEKAADAGEVAVDHDQGL